MNRSLLITLFHYGTGLMDSLTGICLIFAPMWTLERMHVTPEAHSADFISYIGVFVFAVGFSQFFAGRFPSTEASIERWKTLWKVSSLVRFSVAFFVLSKVLSSQLETAWITVALTDFAVALTFTILLSLKKLDLS